MNKKVRLSVSPRPLISTSLSFKYEYYLSNFWGDIIQVVIASTTSFNCSASCIAFCPVAGEADACLPA